MRLTLQACACVAFMLACISAAHAAPIIGVDIEAGNGVPTNWTGYTLADSGNTKSNLVAEDGSTTTAAFWLNSMSAVQNTAVDPSLVPSHSNSLQAVAGDILYGEQNPTVALFSGLTPNATYNYWVFVSSSANDTMTVTGSTVDSFFSPNTSAASQRINGVLGSSSLTFASYARQIISSNTGTISFAIQSTGTPTPSAYAVQLVPEPASLTLLALGSLALLRRQRA